VAFHVSEMVLEETRRNLAQDVPHVLAVFEELAGMLGASIANPGPATVRRVHRVLPTKDAPIIAGALKARARYLVTLDRRHLLSQRDLIQQHFGIMVVTPGEMLRILRSGGVDEDEESQ
jgi:predicted nucleic acid-binding protein